MFVTTKMSLIDFHYRQYKCTVIYKVIYKKEHSKLYRKLHGVCGVYKN